MIRRGFCLVSSLAAVGSLLLADNLLAAGHPPLTDRLPLIADFAKPIYTKDGWPMCQSSHSLTVPHNLGLDGSVLDCGRSLDGVPVQIIDADDDGHLKIAIRNVTGNCMLLFVVWVDRQAIRNATTNPYDQRFARPYCDKG
jgi:hypothetical protein